jgi:RNA polymerase sigma-70 factor (ECF subfamily)
MSLPDNSAVSGVSEASDSVDQPTDDSRPEIEEFNIADSEKSCSSNLMASFCAEHTPSAQRYAMSIVRRWADAEEIVQEAFCRLIESNSSKPDSTGDLLSGSKPLLFSIVRNLAIDRLRKQGRRKFETMDANQIVNKQDTTDPNRLLRIQHEIEKALLEMPNQWADALRLKINGELSYEEISKVLEATHSQVRTWIYRARKQLAKDLTRCGLLEA